MAAPDPEFTAVVDALVPLCTLSPNSRAQVLNHAQVLHFERGAFVFNEGDHDTFAYFLLDGPLELISAGQTIQRLRGGSDQAVHALAQLQPRKMSARAEDDLAILRVERLLLEKLSAIEPSGSDDLVEVAEIDHNDTDDWMTRMLQSNLFENLPAANIHRIFSQLQTISAQAGDIVVRQGEPGDFYYVIVSGRAEITRAAAANAPDYRLALIGPGDAFGEEALVGGDCRNATVKMLSDGELMRLSAEDFGDLIREPLLQAITLEQGNAIETTSGARWLDVRFPEEFAVSALPRSINHPLNTLRMHSGRLDSDVPYIVYCDDGSRSAVAAFLLAERGFEVHFLDGGMAQYQIANASPKPAFEPDLTLHDDHMSENSSVVKSGPIPASHLSEAERFNRTAAASDASKADVFPETRRNTGAPLASPLDDEQTKPVFAPTLARQADSDNAAQTPDFSAVSPAPHAATPKAESEKAVALAAEPDNADVDESDAELELAVLRRIKDELRAAKAAAQLELERERESQVERIEKLRLEMDRRLEQEQQRLQDSYAWQADELKRLQSLKEDAEERLRIEHERADDESAKAQQHLEQARDIQVRLEEEQLAHANERTRHAQADVELRARLREELTEKVAAERTKVERELIRNAEELERACHARDAADAARSAVEEEALKVLSDFEQTHLLKREQLEDSMRVERERLEADAEHLRVSLETAQRQRDDAIAEQQRVENILRESQRQPQNHPVDADRDLSRLRDEAEDAAAIAAGAERKRAEIEAASAISDDQLATHTAREEQSRDGLQHELDDWISNQIEIENSDTQRQVLANQKEILERIKERAKHAKDKVKANDQSLINELAARLDRPED